ncbi:MAG TPA: ABC transporter permease [Dehalococcoidia bacterium]|nr:ABC transporter permease [Dehalococcoidia bacterium]
MIHYVIRRLLFLIPTILLVTIIVFLSIRLIPGDVVDVIQAGMAGAGEIDRETVAHALGLDVPIHVQYGQWLWNIFQGDFGRSLISNTSVSEEILTRLPVSIELGILSLVVTLILAIPIGVYSAIRQDTTGDYVLRSISIACIAIPGFWLATMVIVYPSIWFNWMPPTDMVSFIDNPIKNLQLFIIPAIILGMAGAGYTMRMTRTMMLEVLRQDYVRTAWSKGLKERVVIFRHALKNALIPIVTLIGTFVPITVGGSVVIEQIFVLPGTGTLLLDALSERDYTIVSGVNILIASVILITNLLVDMTYAYLDPRIRYKL